MSTSVELTVVTANIGRGVPPAVRRDNIVRVRHGFPGAIIGWQEIDEADTGDEHAMLAKTFGPDHYRNVGFEHAVPISVPAPWEVIDADVTEACKFLPHATPNRYIVSALSKHPDLAEPVVFMDGHYPLARLGGKEGAARWADTQRAWVVKAAEWHRAGHTIFTTRDTNRLHNMPKVHQLERQLLPNAIARVSVIPGSVSVVRRGTPRHVNLTIDGHDAKGVDLVLSVKKEKA